jgi:hypothetical protein
MSTKKSFGIGCFHFGIKKEPPFQFSGKEYISELKKVLSNISNITDIEISNDEDFESFEEKITDPTPNLSEDRGYYPQAVFFEIKFKIYIPFRIQSEISDLPEKFLDTYSENFKVTIMHSYYMPVCIIECIEPTQKPDPSTSVQIIREFIRKSFKTEKSDYIRFEVLGPSPFHLDCHLEPTKDFEEGEEEDWHFTTEEKLKKGYNEVIIYYNQNLIEESEEALLYLEDTIRDEFGFFYMHIQMRNIKMHFWENIQENLDKLLAIQEEKGIKGFKDRLLKRSHLISQLFTGISNFEGLDIWTSSLRQNAYRETFSIKEQIIFQTFIDKELEDKMNYPAKQTSDLVSFFENRRVKDVEYFIVLIAAILGGTIGAILTILFQD